RPVAVLDVPGHGLHARAVGRGGPDALGAGRRRPAGAGLGAVDGTEGIGVEIGHRRVRGDTQVRGDVLGAGDADEDRLVVARGDLEADVAVAVMARELAEAVAVDVEIVGGDGGRARGEALGVGVDV